jgi:hypothetical protein
VIIASGKILLLADLASYSGIALIAIFSDKAGFIELLTIFCKLWWSSIEANYFCQNSDDATTGSLQKFPA